MLCVLGSLYTRITQDWELSDMRDPTTRVERFASRRLERFPSHEERRTIYEVVQGGLRRKPGSRGHLEHAGVWALQQFAFTGMRRSEILTLTWPMVDWQHNVPLLSGPGRVRAPEQCVNWHTRISGAPPRACNATLDFAHGHADPPDAHRARPHGPP